MLRFWQLFEVGTPMIGLPVPKSSCGEIAPYCKASLTPCQGAIAPARTKRSLDLAVNSASIVLQLFVTGRVAQKHGLTPLLVLVPALCAIGFIALCIWPGFTAATVTMTLRRAGQYGFVRPGREMLFSLVGEEDKYKAKNFLDTVVYRGGDVISAFIARGLDALGGGVVSALRGAAASLLWVINSTYLCRLNLRLARRLSTTGEDKGNAFRTLRKLALAAAMAVMASGAMADMPELKLGSDMEIPQLGIGVWKLSSEEAYQSVLAALKTGYRLMDTAQYYRNEAAVYKAIVDSGVLRKEIFLMSKLNPNMSTEGEIREALDASLERLGGHIDLMLIHWPTGADTLQWRIMEEYQKAGKFGAIGVSNYRLSRLKPILDEATVKPVLDQIEIDPYYTRQNEVRELKDAGIVVQD